MAPAVRSVALIGSLVEASSLPTSLNVMSRRPSSDLAAFSKILEKSRDVVVISGAGVSAESGIPTFRGAGGLWRKYQATDLATSGAFARDPSLVWEFYHYRRELVLQKSPNAAHFALAQCQRKFEQFGRQLTVITQNVDELHSTAGAKNVIELHGSLFRVRCIECGTVSPNRDSPICEALRGRGDPGTVSGSLPAITVDKLPRCGPCGGLLRPHIVWFGENLEEDVLASAHRHLDSCDLCMVIGTSAAVYPAAMFAPLVAGRGVPVAEFNIEDTPATSCCAYHFKGPAGVKVPEALKQFTAD